MGFQSYLNPFQVGDLDLVQRDGHERRFGELDERIRCRLNQHIRAVGNTGKPDFAEGDIHVHPFILAGIGNLFSKCLELTV